MKSSSDKEVSSITREYLYHHEITNDVASNNNFRQSYISSPKCGMKFLQHQMDYASSKEKHKSPSDSSEHHRCIYVDVYHHNVTKNSDANVNNMIL